MDRGSRGTLTSVDPCLEINEVSWHFYLTLTGFLSKAGNYSRMLGTILQIQAIRHPFRFYNKLYYLLDGGQTDSIG